MIHTIIAIILGIICGIITGITPGLHVNTVGIIIFSLSEKITQHTNPLTLCTFFVTIAICHAMIEFIPSLLIGVPTEDTLLSIQPGHRLLFKGEGKKVIRLVSFGGYTSIILLTILFPMLYFILPPIYTLFKDYIAYLLIITMTIILYYSSRQKKRRWINIVIFIASGILGITILSSNMDSNMGLLVMLSGLFSVSSLLYNSSKESEIPPQKETKNITLDKGFKKSVFAGSISGCILGLLPGLGPAQGTLIAQSLTLNRNIKPEEFIVTNSGVNVSDTLFSIIAIYLISNPRSAISVYVSNIINDVTFNHVIFFIIVSIITVSVSCIISIKISDYLIEKLPRMNYMKLNLSIVGVITFIVVAFALANGVPLFYMLICYVTSIALGMIPNIFDTSKSSLMGVLIVPAIITYLGFF
ncbi:MAG: hypothetical protein BZ136_06670 [Methanosphaera sp. rholeuAM74]|nr:MAG: hypothetical protein BZ136_06670 [Methanosphaera sp. rholeuAM74]